MQLPGPLRHLISFLPGPQQKSASVDESEPSRRASRDNMAQAAEEDMTTEGSIDVEVEAEDEIAVAATAATTAATTAAKTAAATAAATAVTAAVTAATAAATAAAAAATAAAAINDQFSSDSDGAAPAFTTVTPVVARTLSATQRRKRRRIKLEDESEGETQREERIEQLQEQSLRAPHQSEEEHFLLSLVPSLQRLPPHRRDYIKLQMCKIIHEENSALTHDMKFLE
ncbi:antifreeze protein Maxi-like isoform X2 [Gouania willdenowi]|uniref:antifreeze protein Maxi-like isoform X2 n=1 Tax=Gouania willdenowi TaxID=441366 RepID=UPI001055FC51|nr:antifreeze protein Maxi-like isoform X2 [Gouania willdenowi]